MTDEFINLAAPEAGAAILAVSDDFFAAARRMLDPAEPQFIAGLYDANGKWMDGWESRRRRDAGHDHCTLRIRPGVIERLVIDTRHFIGNYPASCEVEACHVEGDPAADTAWFELLPQSRLGPDTVHEFAPVRHQPVTHLRLHIYPDGGVARLRAFGKPRHPMPAPDCWSDLSSGGKALGCNDQHFGHMDNLLKPDAPQSMADGWETRRRREPGNDYVILRMGRAGRIRCALVDTAFFRGNFPARCSLRGVLLGDAPLPAPEVTAGWPLVLPPLALGADQVHRFEEQLLDAGPVDHVRLDIFPDGGVARLRLLGESL
jgi:allantoicase